MSAVELEKYKKRHEELSKSRTRIVVELESAAKQLKELREEAELFFGTSDVPELEKLLEKMTKDNEQTLSEFIASLDQVAADVKVAEAILAK